MPVLFVLVACGGGDGSARSSPTAVEQLPTAPPPPSPAPVAPSPVEPEPAAPNYPAIRIGDAHFIDQNVGYVDAQGEVLLTVDGGANWRRSLVPAPTSKLRPLFADARHGWAFVDNGASIKLTPLFRTVDGGRSWQALPELPLRLPQGQWLVGQTLIITGQGPAGPETITLVSDDGGVSWRTAALPVTGVTPEGVLLAEGLSFRYSTDLGRTSRSISLEYPTYLGKLIDLSRPPAVSVILGHPADQPNGPLGVTHYASADGNAPWAATPVRFPEGLTGDISRDRVAIAGTNGWMINADRALPAQDHLLRTADSGRTWSEYLPPNQVIGSKGWRARLLDSSTISVTQDGGATWISVNSGLTWRQIVVPGETDLLVMHERIGPGVVQASYGAYMKASDCTSGVSRQCFDYPLVKRRWSSSDGGATWHPVPIG